MFRLEMVLLEALTRETKVVLLMPAPPTPAPPLPPITVIELFKT